MIAFKNRRIQNRMVAPALGVLAAAGLTIGAMALQPGMGGKPGDMGGMNPDMAKMMAMLQGRNAMRGYLDAHRDVSNPLDLLGGKLKITLKQKQGGVFVALPDNRRLDETVFGTPDMPVIYGGTPGITGLPPMARAMEGGKYTTMTMPSPFGDKFMVMGGANLDITAVDETATDGATTKDSVDMKASWKDREGNTYEVRCNMVMSRGLEFPTFGGVVTNHILHGVTGLGTPLMPTEFTYFAFWGMGDVLKNGEVIDKGRLIHGMLTEYVRADKYALAFDHEVNAIRKHFHLMVSPFKPNMNTGHFDMVPVKTGMMMKMPDGMEMELPFWHVMFESVDDSAKRG